MNTIDKILNTITNFQKYFYAKSNRYITIKTGIAVYFIADQFRYNKKDLLKKLEDSIPTTAEFIKKCSITIETSENESEVNENKALLMKYTFQMKLIMLLKNLIKMKIDYNEISDGLEALGDLIVKKCLKNQREGMKNRSVYYNMNSKLSVYDVWNYAEARDLLNKQHCGGAFDYLDYYKHY